MQKSKFFDIVEPWHTMDGWFKSSGQILAECRSASGLVMQHISRQMIVDLHTNGITRGTQNSVQIV